MQVTSGEEDRAGAARSPQRILLPKMRAKTGHVDLVLDATWAGALGAVDATIPTAEMAIMKRGLRGSDALTEAAFVQQRFVYGKRRIRCGHGSLHFTYQRDLSTKIVLLNGSLCNRNHAPTR